MIHGDSERPSAPPQIHDDQLGKTKTELVPHWPEQTPRKDSDRTFEEQAVVANRFRILRFLARGGMGEIN